MNICPQVLMLIYALQRVHKQHMLNQGCTCHFSQKENSAILTQLVRCAMSVYYHIAQSPNFEVLTVSMHSVGSLSTSFCALDSS